MLYCSVYKVGTGTGIIETISRQMHDIYYNLPNIPSPMASAPACNVFTEETLALADYHFRDAYYEKIC